MSRLFTETPDQEERLAKLNSSYVCGVRVRGDRREVSVALIDNTTGVEYHRAYHAESYSAALDAALASVTSKPKSTAEIAADSAALADENARLRALVEQLKSSQPTDATAMQEAAPAITRKRSTT